MSSTYRISRNLEASFIDYIEAQLVTDGWNNVEVEKTFSRIYRDTSSSETKKSYICVRLSDTIHDKAEIGNTSTIRTPLVLIDIFGTGDGNRLDLKDWLISILKSGISYYDYVISNGTIQSKTANGRIRVLNIGDTPVDFNIDKNELDVKDRYRHLLSIEISLGRIET